MVSSIFNQCGTVFVPFLLVVLNVTDANLRFFSSLCLKPPSLSLQAEAFRSSATVTASWRLIDLRVVGCYESESLVLLSSKPKCLRLHLQREAIADMQAAVGDSNAWLNVTARQTENFVGECFLRSKK